MAYEKRTLVDNETVIDKDLLDHMQDGISAAHDSIGTADISGIGDGTVMGAILALKAMIESGGGSGGNTGDFAIVLQNKNAYIDNTNYIVDGETYYSVDAEKRVPTMEQMEGCSLVCTVGETTGRLRSPIIEEYADETGINYLIRFEELELAGSVAELWQQYAHIYVVTTGDTNGAHVNFDGLVESFNYAVEGSYSDIVSGTLTFQVPQSGGDSGGSDDEDVNLPAAAYSVYVHDENYYGENAVMDYGESAEGRRVDSRVPTLTQMQRCEMRAGFPGEISCKLGDPEVVDYGGNKDHYAIYFRSIPEEEMSLSLDIPHLLVSTTLGDYDVGVYVVFEAFAQTHGAIWEGEASMDYANLDFPEVL